MVVINIVTVAVCLAMLLIFRRLDKSNMKIAKLRRYSSKVFDDFKKMAEKENRKLNDSTIEMDILLKKSHALSTNLHSSLKEIEMRLQGLDIEKTNLRKVEDDLKVISQSARNVNKQIEFLADARDGFSDLAKNVSILTETVETLKKESGGQIQAFNNKLKERTKELLHEFGEQFNKMRDEIGDKEDALIGASRAKISELELEFEKSMKDFEQKIGDTGNIILDNFKSKIENVAKSVEGAANLGNQIEMLKINTSDLENRVFNEIKERMAAFDRDINNALDGTVEKMEKIEGTIKDYKDTVFSDINEKATRFETSMNDSYNRLSGKVKAVDGKIEESKERLITFFEDEVNKVRSEMDSLSIHAVSKRDEIVQAARKEAEDMKKKIDDFKEYFTATENKLERKVDEQIVTLHAEYNSFENRFSSITEKLNSREEQIDTFITSQLERMKNDFGIMEVRLSGLKSEIINYEESNQVFAKTDAMILKVEGAIEELKRMLAQATEESRSIDKFFDDVSRIKDLTKSFEKEIRVYQGKREKMIEIEKEIKSLMDMSDQTLVKFSELHEESLKIDMISSQIDAVRESYSGLEVRLAEIHEYEEMITKNLESVNKTDIIIQGVEGRINAFQKTVDRTEKRVDKINQHLLGIEQNTLVLKTRENELKDIRDKFNELESVSVHMEKRIEQIYAMFNKVEKLREEIESTDQKVQEMFIETDKKMRQFADFIQAVDAHNPIAKQVKDDVSTSVKNINDTLIRTIRDLSSKGWSSAEISKKLLIDESSVRLIINTSSL